MFLPWAVRAVGSMVSHDVQMSFMGLYLLLGLSSVVMKRYHFGQVGENAGHAAVRHKFSKITGAYPPLAFGHPFDPSWATVPLHSPNVPPQKNKARLLGMGCGRTLPVRRN